MTNMIQDGYYGFLEQVYANQKVDLNELKKDPYIEIEGVIDKSGKFYYLETGGHNQLLLYLASKELETSMTTIEKETPVEYYANYEFYLEKLGYSISVRKDFQTFAKKITKAQKSKLLELQEKGFIDYNPIQGKD